MPLREVKNAQGDIAMFDDETGNIMPTRPKTAAEAPVVSQTQLKQVKNAQGQTALFDPDTGALFPQQQVTEDIQKTQQHLEATKPQRGTDLTPTPIQPKEPLFMEKYGLPRPPGAETMAKVGPAAAQFALGMTPVGRTGQMILGGGLGAMEPAESLGERATNAAIGAVTPLIGEAGGKVVKSGLRTVSKFMSPGAMRAAGSAIQEGVKEIATPVAPTATREALDAVGKSLRTPKAAMNALSEHVDKMVSSYKAGKPFSYGDFFEHANQIGQKAHQFFESSSGQASGRALKTVQDAMMKDLAAIGPDAAHAAEAWKNAVGGIGGWGSAKKIWTALGASSIPGVGALVAPVAGAAGGAGAVVSALAGLGVRAPGVGQSLAKSLISPDGTVLKAALPALAQLIKDANKEY